MKRLSILRHAKSDWDDRRLSDHDRPLNKRGLRDAPMLGLLMQQESIVPNRIIASSAKRAMQTAELVGGKIGFPADRLHTEPELYLASTEKLLNVAARCDNKIEHLMLVAHNPGMTYLVNEISDVTLDNLPTCGLFCIELDIENWQDVVTAHGSCIWYHYPKLNRQD